MEEETENQSPSVSNPPANGPAVPPPLPDWTRQAAGWAMNCFSHPDREGIGVCRLCNRTLCRECVTEVSGLCCCKARCDASVRTPKQRQRDLLQHLLGFQKIGEPLIGQVFRSARWTSGVLLVITGIAVLSPHDGASFLGSILIAIGAVRLGIYGFVQWKKPLTE